MEIPIYNPNDGELPINFYFDTQLDDGRTGLVRTPGLTAIATLAADKEVRGIYNHNAVLYVVCGNGVYKYNGALTTLTGTLGSTGGHVQMVANPTQIMINDGVRSYYITVATNTVTQIVDADYPANVVSIAFQNGYGIALTNTGRFYFSGINDFSSWGALDYLTAEIRPDQAKAVISHLQTLIVLGLDGTEIYYSDPNPDAPFSRIQGGYMSKGCGATHSVAIGDNTPIWLSNERQIVRMVSMGAMPQVISTRKLDELLQTYDTVSDAYAFCPIIKGYAWYVITFPSEDITFAYNLVTQSWFKWLSFAGSVFQKHRANCHAFYEGRSMVGDVNDGKLYKIDPTVYTDGESFRTIKSQITMPPVLKEGHNLFFSKLQLNFKVGVGLVSGQGSNPQVMVDWSDDNRKTWSNEHWVGIGKIGEYKDRAILRRMGCSRNRSCRVSYTDPTECILYNPAYAEITVGLS